MSATPAQMVGTGIKLFLLCVVVGLIMAAVGVDDPWQVWGNFIHWLKNIWDNMGDWLKWSIGYAVLGAGIVLPIYFIRLAWRMSKGRKSAG